MDIFAIEAVVRELRGLVAGTWVNKIHQPAAGDLLLRLWDGREERRLLLSCSQPFSRMHLTAERYPNPFTPPRFCQLLRARLSRLSTLQQVAGERVIRIGFLGREGEAYTLIAELLGRKANLILLDGGGVIVDALQRSAGGAQRREISPGIRYQLPAARERLELRKGVPEVPTEASDPPAFAAWLLAALTPMTPLVAADLAGAVAAGKTPRLVLERFRHRWLAGEVRPAVGIWRGRRVLSILPLQQITLTEEEVFPTVSAAIDRFHVHQQLYGRKEGVRGELEEAIRRQRRRLETRLRHIDREQVGSEILDEKRQTGELILANLHRIRRGMSEVTLDNWYSNPPRQVTLSLDPRLSPQENAERYFRGYKKGKRGRAHIKRRLAETQAELTWLEEAILALEEAETPADLLALRLEFEEAGLVHASPEPAFRKRPPDPASQVRHARSPGGFDLYWGKNSRTNDYVSRRLTGDADLWFHAHNLPGCHLVLKHPSPATPIPEEDILFAAAVAAVHSRGKTAGKVEVMVAEGREVGKPRGARPGLVTVRHFRTVVVRPQDVAGT